MYVLSKTTLYVAIGVVAAVILTAVICNAADHAIVSFDDAEHLAAQVDSIVSCDSTALTESMATMMDGGHYRMVTDTVDYLVITCRRLVCVTVTVTEQLKQQGHVITEESMLKASDGMEIPLWDPATSRTKDVHTVTAGSPGQAIIFYEEEQCIK